jgi:hypothetical protein
VICDIVVLYIMRDRDIYRDKKFLQVRGSDAFNVYTDLSRSHELEEEQQGQQGVRRLGQGRSIEDR